MAEVTEEFYFDREKVEQIKPLMDDVNDVELIFKALSDPTRLKIAYALTLTEELCVNDVAHIIDSTTATASHHLRLLRNMKLTKYIKDGINFFYYLDDYHVRHTYYIYMLYTNEVDTHCLSE